MKPLESGAAGYRHTQERSTSFILFSPETKFHGITLDRHAIVWQAPFLNFTALVINKLRLYKTVSHVSMQDLFWFVLSTLDGE